MTMTATMRSVRSLRGPQRDHWQWTNILISRTLCIIHAGSKRGKCHAIVSANPSSGGQCRWFWARMSPPHPNHPRRHPWCLCWFIFIFIVGSASFQTSVSMYCASGWILKGLSDWQLALVYQRAMHPSLHRRCHAGMMWRHPSRSWPKT
ncbi:hypothetical protein B0H13DRAFT_1918305 [Mycena leptocephala]|nr:hypothetical protein B0H13DRAFT_1918305 [Mycena leptocephala]